MRRRDFLKAATALAVGSASGVAARAEDSRDTLVTMSEEGPNTLDMHVPGANRGGYQVVWNTYDRLLTHGVTTDAHGNATYDYRNLQPAFAEEWDLRDMSVTFKLRKDVTFADGTPATAKDVKFSFDRIIGLGGVPKSNLASASLNEAEQCVIVDPHTIRIDFQKKDKLTLPEFAQPYVGIYHSELVKQHATEEDPWGVEWTKFNGAGTGAYRAESWTPGQDVVFVRNDAWKCGPLPKIKRVIWRSVPSAGTRRAILERGDADFSFDLPPKDVAEMVANKDLKIIGSLAENTVQYLAMNVTMPPFDNLKVRQAFAYAVPYRKIMEVALYNRARPLFGGPPRVIAAQWPTPHHYTTDLAKAKQLLAEAGHPNGFDMSLSFDAGTAVTQEPLCTLLQESLGEIGIKVTLNMIPGANWRTAFSKKTLPFQSNIFGGFFNYPDYYFLWVYHGQNTIFNVADYRNPVMDKLIDEAHYAADPALRERDTIAFIQLAFDDIPTIPLYQPYVDVAMRKNIDGYRFWFHRQLDFRTLVKG
jgi:peptide/nickel transport system substrate-binding protein